MSENLFEQGMKNVTDFQKNIQESMLKLGEQFDLGQNAKDLAHVQEQLAKSVKLLMDMKDEDVASDTLEKEEVLSIGKMKLYHYKPLVAQNKVSKTPTLITYALVNRQYMMDIQPDRSVIKAFLESGMDVYIIDWGYPTAEDKYLTMDDYINWYIDDCVDYIRETTGAKQINLLGVCQGGTFSTIYTALHPDKIKNLVTMVVPIDFSGNDGLLFRWGKHMNIDSLVDAYGVVPGDTMNVAYLILKPLELTMNKYVNIIDKLDDPEFMQNFMRMEKWVFDSPDQAGETLRQMINDLYRDNKLIKGELELGGQKVDLKNIKVPVLCACAEKDHLVPLSASEPLMEAIGSKDKEFVSFPTGHIGMYVSSKSQKEIAPKITEWLNERS